MNKPQGLAAIEGKSFLTYDDLISATGLTLSTLRTYVHRGYCPKPDRPGVWDATRQDIKDFITGTGRPGRGARTDLRDVSSDE